MLDRTFQSRAELEAHQLERLRELLRALAPNPFYGPRIRSAGLDEEPEALSGFSSRMPFTTKSELIADQERHPPHGSNLTFPLEAYTRLHATSSTTGRTPLRWLDTPESWTWLLDGWEHTLVGAGVGPADRVLFAFSFGPFLGFWVGFEAAVRMGCLCLPGGALSSAARYELLAANRVTVLCCTPTYALHLGETARAAGRDPAASSVRTLIVAGEPGGCVPTTRARIESLWGAEVYDHYGMTEVGPVTYQLAGEPERAYLVESNYLAEVVDPETGAATPSGQLGELVLTTLDQVVRAHDGVAEYRVDIDRRTDMTELSLTIEPGPACTDAGALRGALERDLRDVFSLRIPVSTAAAGSLPRFELKARRWVEVTS